MRLFHALGHLKPPQNTYSAWFCFSNYWYNSIFFRCTIVSLQIRRSKDAGTYCKSRKSYNKYYKESLCRYYNVTKKLTIAFYALALAAITFLLSAPKDRSSEVSVELAERSGKTIKERFSPPKGYQRIQAESKSFGAYLQNFPLHESERRVHYYNGYVKSNPVHAAVLDIDVGDRDLQQCADAIMRLRSEYLYETDQKNSIAFNLVNGFRLDFKQWSRGRGIAVDGNNVRWKPSANNDDGRKSFKRYLTMVFAYAGTLSLEKEMNFRNWQDMQIGDVIIQGGSPGHAVLVVDMAEHTDGRKVFMLAQSYMPAQDIHVLVNETRWDLSPWYSLDEDQEQIITPEWTFKKSDLRSF